MTVDPAPRIPVTVKVAAGLLVAYGVMVFINATWSQIATDWEYRADYPRGLVRTLGMILIASGLLRGARWAWWIGVTLPMLWLLAGITATVIAIQEGGLLGFAGGLVTLLLMNGLLLAPVVLLLLPQSRAAFRKPRIAE